MKNYKVLLYCSQTNNTSIKTDLEENISMENVGLKCQKIAKIFFNLVDLIHFTFKFL